MDPSSTNTTYGMHPGVSQSNQSVCSSVACQDAIGQHGLSNYSLEETYKHLYTTLSNLGKRILDLDTLYNNISVTSAGPDKTLECDMHYLFEKRNQLVSNLSTNVQQLKFLERPRSRIHADVNLKDRLKEEAKELKVLKNDTQTMIDEANKFLAETANRHSELMKRDDSIFSSGSCSEADELVKKLETSTALQKEIKKDLSYVLSTVFPSDYEEIKELLAALVDASKTPQTEDQYIDLDQNPLIYLLWNCNLIIPHPEDSTKFKLEEFRF